MNLQNSTIFTQISTHKSMDKSDNNYFKLAFFGSSSFVLPILENILESENQTLAKIAIKQLKNLWQKEMELELKSKLETESEKEFEKEYEIKEKTNKDVSEDVNETLTNKKSEENLAKSDFLDLGIKPIWWKSREILELLEFALSLENDLANGLINNLESGLKNVLPQNENSQNQIEKIENQQNHQIPQFFENNPKSAEIITNLLKKIKLELIVTQPDRINGKKIIQNPISEFAKNHNLKLEMPIKINSEIEDLKQKYQLDSAIVASFGQILNSKVLNFPKFGIINWHPSLLPKYRGATPIQTTLLENQKISGLSWITMTKGMDSGPIWLQIPKTVEDSDTFQSFAEKMGKLGHETWALPIIANLIDKIMINTPN